MNSSLFSRRNCSSRFILVCKEYLGITFATKLHDFMSEGTYMVKMQALCARDPAAEYGTNIQFHLLQSQDYVCRVLGDISQD